jgi:hypothetical protein
MTMSRNREWRRIFAATSLAATMLLSGRALADESEGAGKLELIALSTRPDMVSGGDVLVQVNVPAATRLDQVVISLNGRNVTASFHPGRAPGSLVGLVKGLTLGRNTLTAAANRRVAARLALINHPIAGPIFSGPHQTPFICETASFALPVTGGTLGPPLDADCSIATRGDYVYKSTAGTFKPLPDPSVRPADLAQTTTSEGRTVPYVVRVETGTINRAVYQLLTLHDPKTDPAPSPWTPPAGWNGRLIYSYGGGCRSSYHQGQYVDNFFPTGPVVLAAPLNDAWLSLGYAVAASTLNIFNNNCNDVISAETTMMVKERFIEQFGPPRYTMGWGASGGSMQQHLIAHNYPGLLDGITPSSSFSDALALTITASDCALLVRAFVTSTQSWSFGQKTAVAGWGTWDFCTTFISADWGLAFKAGRSSRLTYAGCSGAVPPSLIYDPVSNPMGARCTYQDNAVNIFGRDHGTGFAPSPLDNVGVQYGLKAFNAGQISAEQFLDLNERVGGYDIDGNLIAGRTEADPTALRIAYSTGRVDTGSGALGSIPMIDFRTYRDDVADPHDSVRSYSTRARLIAANGNADNQVILTGSRVGTGSGSAAAVAATVLRLMDQWLNNIANDSSDISDAAKVVRNKPPELVDACYTVTGQKITDQSVCRQLYPRHGNPRLAAGEPLANDVLKCTPKPVDRRDYVQTLTDEQFARLKAIFPQGVCDYSRRGVEQQLVKDTWLSYPLHGDDDEDEHDD